MSISISVIPLGIENLKRARTALESLVGALASKATDKLRVSIVDAIPLSPFNLMQISGTALTARDWSQDFAKLQNLDTTLSSRASETTLSAIKAQTDKLSFDANNRLAIQNPPNLDVALSTRASETTLSSFSSKFPSATTLSDNLSNPTTTIIGSALLGFDGTYFRRVAVDSSSRLRVVAESVANPSNLDVALSTRASESTLSAISGALASKATDKLRVSVVDALPRSPFTLYDSAGAELSGYIKNIDTALSSFTGSPGGSAPSKGVVMLGFDGTYLRIIKTTSDGRLLAQLG